MDGAKVASELVSVARDLVAMERKAAPIGLRSGKLARINKTIWAAAHALEKAVPFMEAESKKFPELAGNASDLKFLVSKLRILAMDVGDFNSLI
jgi:hypothetical protein